MNMKTPKESTPLRSVLWARLSLILLRFKGFSGSEIPKILENNGGTKTSHSMANVIGIKTDRISRAIMQDILRFF
jgi:hypothetical protein